MDDLSRFRAELFVRAPPGSGDAMAESDLPTLALSIIADSSPEDELFAISRETRVDPSCESDPPTWAEAAARTFELDMILAMSDGVRTRLPPITILEIEWYWDRALDMVCVKRMRAMLTPEEAAQAEDN